MVLGEVRTITLSFHCLVQLGLAPLCARHIDCVHHRAYFGEGPHVTRRLQTVAILLDTF